MKTLIFDSWILIGLFLIILLSKIVNPRKSYELKISLILGCIGTIIFSIQFLFFLTGKFHFWPILFSIIFCYICLEYIKSGGKTVKFKTMTAVFSNINGEIIGKMYAGSLNWADPIFEKVTVSIDGIPNISADLQKLEIIIPQSDRMHTAEPGIQAKIRKINFMLVLDSAADIDLLFEIEGGSKTIRERIESCIEKFLIKSIGKIKPEDLDTDRGNILNCLGIDLGLEVNNFCKDTYPYKVTDKVNIGDIELDEVYYTALSKEKLAKLEQKAKDAEAVSLKVRLKDLGDSLLPNGTPAEKLAAAQLTLGITKKDTKEIKFSTDGDTGDILKNIANIFKK